MPCLVAAVAFVALVFFTVSPSFAQTWFARGQFHEASDELRAPGFWGADSGNMVRDDGSNGDVVAGDGIFSCLVPAAQAPGRYEFKIASLDWSDEAPVGFNINCVVETFEADEPILVTFDTNVYSDGWIPTTRAVWSDHLVQPLLGWFVVGGVPELGSWDPTSGLVAVPSGDLFRAVVWIDTVGPTEYKWTADLSWVWQEVGGQGFSIRDTSHNVPVDVTTPGYYEFLMDPSTGRVIALPLEPTPVETLSWGRIKSLHRRDRFR